MRRVVLPLLPILAVWFALSATAPVVAAPSAPSCGALNGSSLRLSGEGLANPNSLLICQARQALQRHTVVTASGTASSVGQLSQVLGVSLPQASVSQPVQSAFLGAHLDSQGVLQVYEGFAAPGQAAAASTQLSQWVAAQAVLTSAALISPPSNVAWTPLMTAQTSYTDSQGSSETFSMSDFRLNDINSAVDWYLFASRLQTTPKYLGCDNNACGPYVISRNVNEPGASPLSLKEWGPNATITGTNVGLTVGTSLSIGATDVGVGVSTAYSQSWDQPSVTTSPSVSGNQVSWTESFTGPSYLSYPAVVPPPATATSSFQSEQATIFEVPEGTTSASLTSSAGYETQTDSWSSYTCFIFFTCYSLSSHYVGVGLSLRMTAQPPVFSASPSSLVLKAGASGTINIQSLVPGSTQGLTWDVTNIPSWLAVSQLIGSTSASLTATVQVKTPAGSIAYLNINTSPAYAAPSVERGPIVVAVSVVKH